MKKQFKIILAKVLCLFLYFGYLSAQTEIGQAIIGENNGDLLGYSISLSADGNRIAVGIPLSDDSGENSGQVQVLEWSNNQWTPLGQVLVGDNINDRFGIAVSISGNGLRLSVGILEGAEANNFSPKGRIRTYQLQEDQWVQLGGDIKGETVVIGKIGRDLHLSYDGSRLAFSPQVLSASPQSSIKIYEWNDIEWKPLGNSIEPEIGEAVNYPLVSLSANGDRVAIKKFYSTEIYEWNGVSWEQMSEDIVSIDNFLGYDDDHKVLSLSADGNRVAIGAPFNDGFKGLVQIYEWNGSEWFQLGQTLTGTSDYEEFGSNIALSEDGNIVVISSPRYDQDIFNSIGLVNIYKWDGSMWDLYGEAIVGDTPLGELGSSLDISSDGKRIAISTPGFLGNSGRVQIFDIIPTSVEDNNLINLTSIIPNPTNGFIRIGLSKSYNDVKLEIITMSGQLIETKTFKEVSIIDHTISHPAGLYVLKLIKDHRETEFHKIVKK